ncbi:polysaccharide pyruvyl transferase family protein [Leeuwenhoekiella blandensis]|uniref:Succinoglycan biosynthesis ketolase n=1 Tax=Leeuwenhoekiella blandensis (strain CECT 7118 / CCUG 51940 / KCTC 22103 / MED217) TaxID=398720 RepID=A3XR81_LEEBM|nr:polysaccharide pyruvyl transferase family protein [Leeuwenhoekiella blandensis]EAQ47946.1 succinoglycan biosynthesis ketolase [Leeuwenhoekiella blandensis MED217]
MHYLYFKSPKGNFGDDLNPWLWEKLWGDVSQVLQDTYFLGIGSILHNGNKNIKELQSENKIVFGSGIRPASDYSHFQIDPTWDIRFLRGPLSSASLNNKYEYITDAAYAIRHIDNFESLYINQQKKYKISLMPYFHSVEYFDWRTLCADLGIHYISPHSENGVEETLKEIAQSEFLITEAMHGAILADALRVPWHRFVLSSPHTEGGRVSEFKWEDWKSSLNIDKGEVSFFPFYTKSGRLNKWSKKLSGYKFSLENLNKKKVEELMRERFSKNRGLVYSLSEDSKLALADEKIKVQIDRLNKDLSL